MSVNSPVQPHDINTEKHFWNAFGNWEAEHSANIIVRVCAKKGGWHSFSQEELNEEVNGKFHFNGLIDQGHVLKDKGKGFFVTMEFIAKCWGSSPAKQEKS